MVVYLSRFLVSTVRQCKDIFRTRLLLSNTLSTMALLGIGDAFTQYIEIKLTEKRQRPFEKSFERNSSQSHSFLRRFDWQRTGILLEISNLLFWFNSKWKYLLKAKVSCVGLLTGPFGHYWYLILDRKLPHKTKKSILTKVLCDQLIAAPIFNFLFITAIHTLDGKHIKQVLDIFKEKFLTIYAVCFCFYFYLA